MLDGDGFVFPKRKGKSRRRRKNAHAANTEVAEPVADLKSKVDDCLSEIKGSQFYANFRDSLHRCLQMLESSVIHETMLRKVFDKPGNTKDTELVETTKDSSLTDTFPRTLSHTPTSVGVKTGCHPSQTSDSRSDVHTNIQDIICYGLGNFSTCVIARYQMALLLALRENLNVDLQRCQLYDPRFTECEKDYLRASGVKLIAENEEGKRTCHETMLFYMPHCDKPLYNNLLYANWGLGLRNIIIIGNSFSTTVQNFFMFPDNLALKKGWIHSTRQKGFIPTEYRRICSHHFPSESYERNTDELERSGYYGGQQSTKT
ncbi:SRR1-like protein isoform X2 [Liolophura sinensis]|uniref:SRR1-like protein isoform X2 n=1 Tax=Liolophura sinensis TaxID=3198878 RepID=UPI003158E82C